MKTLKIFSKPQGLELWYLVCSITYWTSIKLVQIIPLGLKMALPWGPHILHGLDAWAVYRAHWGLPFEFLLLQYSVVFTVESSCLLYLLFISWFICSRRWCIDKLGSFMQTKHLCVLIHIWTKGEVGAPLNRFKPSSKIFYWPFKGGTSFLDLLCCFFLSCVCYAFVRVCLFVPYGHLLGKG